MTKYRRHIDYFDRNVVGVSKVVSSDMAREALTGVLFETDKDTTKAVACDGFMLAITKTEAKLTGLIPGKAFMSKSIVGENESGTVTVIRSSESFSRVYPKLDKEYFPKYQKIVDEKQENPRRVGLGLGVLEKIVAMMKASGNTTLELNIPENTLKPIKGKAGEIELILMPVRLMEER